MVSDVEHRNKRRAGALEATSPQELLLYIIVYSIDLHRRVLPIWRLIVLVHGKANCERTSNYKQWRD